jgi:hypothetical protein
VYKVYRNTEKDIYGSRDSSSVKRGETQDYSNNDIRRAHKDSDYIDTRILAICERLDPTGCSISKVVLLHGSLARAMRPVETMKSREKIEAHGMPTRW